MQLLLVCFCAAAADGCRVSCCFYAMRELQLVLVRRVVEAAVSMKRCHTTRCTRIPGVASTVPFPCHDENGPDILLSTDRWRDNRINVFRPRPCSNVQFASATLIVSFVVLIVGTRRCGGDSDRNSSFFFRLYFSLVLVLVLLNR